MWVLFGYYSCLNTYIILVYGLVKIEEQIPYTHMFREIGLYLQLALTVAQSIMKTIGKTHVFSSRFNKDALLITIHELGDVQCSIQFMLASS